MIRIEKANIKSTEVLALLGRITYAESHGQFISDKNDLEKYTSDTFSVSRTKQDLNNLKHLFYIVYSDDLPVGYAKLILNSAQTNADLKTSCRLERIYILNDFLSLKIGQALLTFIEEKVRQLQFDTIWLTVYTENNRVIRFYERNEYKSTGELDFIVNGKEYITIVYSKNIR